MRPTPATASFPRSPNDLRSTQQCPACFTPLRAVVCHTCGLNLAHPLAAELATLSTTIADDLDARLRLIDRMRREPVTAPHAEPLTAVASDDPPRRAPSPPVYPDPPFDSPQPTPDSGGVDDAGPPLRRSGVQIALIIVGVSLLSVFAVFGVVYAFITYGVTVRTILIAVATVSTMVAASALSRRGLGATAEGLAALGTVVLVLDAWALRRGDVAGLAAVPDAGYWGAALLVVAVVAATWAPVGGHRSPLLASAVLAPIGAGLLAAHAVAAALAGADSAVGAIAASATALAVVALATRRGADAPQRVLRTVAAVSSLASIPIGGIVMLGAVDQLSRESWQWSALAGVGFAAIAALGATLAARRIVDQRVGTATASVLAVTATLSTIATVIVSADSTRRDDVVLLSAVIATVGLAAVMDAAQWRRATARLRVPLTVGALTAAAASILTVGAAIAVAVGALVDAATRGALTPATAVTAPIIQSEPTVTASVAALALAALIVLTAWVVSGAHTSRPRLTALAAGLGVVATLTLSLTTAWWATMALGALLAVGSGTALARRRRRPAPSTPVTLALTVGLAVTATGAAMASLALGRTLDGGWWVGVVIAVAALTLGRVSTPAPVVRAVATAVTALIVIAFAPALAEAVAVDAIALTIAISAMLIVLGRMPGSTALERVATLTPALAIALLLAVIDADADPTHAVVDALALLTLAAALAIVAIDRRPGVDRLLSLIALGPVTAVLAARSLVAALALSGDPAALPVAADLRAISALCALAVLATLAALCATARDRLVLDTGIGITALVATTAASGSETTYIAVLIASVIALALAVSRDGLVSSQSPRRYIGWLALALATAALWRALADEGVAQPEPFVLPLGAALLVIAVLVGRTPRAAAPRLVSGPSVIAGAGLVISGLPLAALAADAPAARGAAVGLIATALALAAVIGRVRGVGRWTGLRTVILITSIATQVTLTVSVITRSVTDSVVAVEPLVQLSSILVVMMLTGTAVAAWWSAPRGGDSRVRSRLYGASTATTAGVAMLAALAVGIAQGVDPIELLTVPLALGLLLIGTLELDQRPAARSIPWLAPGLVILLVPSLTDVSVSSEVWRIVALGTVATVVMIGGVVRRLQAPFVIGGLVLLIHAIVQSWPLLTLIRESVEWWIWLGIAGISVVAVAARYERRVQNVANTVRRISELR